MVYLLIFNGDFWSSFIKGLIFGLAIALLFSYFYKKKKEK